jgi:hypothetical protein
MTLSGIVEAWFVGRVEWLIQQATLPTESSDMGMRFPQVSAEDVWEFAEQKLSALLSASSDLPSSTQKVAPFSDSLLKCVGLTEASLPETLRGLIPSQIPNTPLQPLVLQNVWEAVYGGGSGPLGVVSLIIASEVVKTVTARARNSASVAGDHFDSGKCVRDAIQLVLNWHNAAIAAAEQYIALICLKELSNNSSSATGAAEEAATCDIAVASAAISVVPKSTVQKDANT